MKKILVIGCPGSGKSTFSRALHQKTGLPLYHLDNLYWNADRTTVEKSLFLSRLNCALQEDRWIIDGNYASTMELRIRACDTVIFLDYPTALCLEGVRQRAGTPRSDIPWVAPEEDAEFISLIKNFPDRGRPEIVALLEKYPEKTVYIFSTRTQADTFLAQL